MKFTKQFSQGLSLLSTYVWSKALDNGSEDLIGWTIGSMWRDSYNTNLDYAVSTHDVPHSFATALVYQLPYGKNKRWGSSAPGYVRQVLGNWEVSSIVRLTSGLPLLPVYYQDNPLGRTVSRDPDCRIWSETRNRRTNRPITGLTPTRSLPRLR